MYVGACFFDPAVSLVTWPRGVRVERILFAAQALLCVAGIACLMLLPLQKIVERYGELL